METVAIEAKKRENTGKSAARKLRRDKLVPCIVYGGDETLSVVCREKDFKDLVYNPEFKLADLNIDGKTHKCILKDIQFHPVTEQIMHADFLKMVDGVNIKVQIPLRIKGVSPGVKDGGKMQQLLRKVKIKTNPEYLVNEVFIDISELELGSALRVKDIDVPEGVEIMNASGIPVVTVQVPRALKSAASKEAKEGVEAETAEEGEKAAAEE